MPWLWILLFICLVVCSLILWKQSERIRELTSLTNNNSRNKTNNYHDDNHVVLRRDERDTTSGGVESPIARDVFEMISPYIDENGPKTIIKYLHDFWDISSADQTKIKAFMRGDDFKDVGTGSDKRQQSRYLALLIQHIIDDNIIVDKYDFVRQSALSWKSFCSAEQAHHLLSRVHPYSSSAKIAIRELIDKIADSETKHIFQSIRQSVQHEIENKRIYKIKKAFVKKSIAALTKAHKDTVYEPDLIAMAPLVVDYLSARSDTATSVSDITRQLQNMKLLQSDVRSIRDLDDLLSVLKLYPLTSKVSKADLDRARRERESLLEELKHSRQQLKECQERAQRCREDPTDKKQLQLYEDQVSDYGQLVRHLEANLSNCESKVQALEREVTYAVDKIANSEMSEPMS